MFFFFIVQQQLQEEANCNVLFYSSYYVKNRFNAIMQWQHRQTNSSRGWVNAENREMISVFTGPMDT